MRRPPPIPNRADTPFPYTTSFRSKGSGLYCRQKPGRGTATSMSGVEGPGRFLPLPVHASEAARAMLAAPSTMAAATPYPADDDKAGWRDHVEAVNAQLIGAMQPKMAGLAEGW